MITTAIDRIAKSSNVLLTTFRKDGRPVATPVGGVVSNGRLYILSYSNTGKLKRLRNDAHVVVAPCNSVGTIPPDADSLEGAARVLDREETKHAYRLMARKNPLARLARAWYAVRRKPDPWVGIEVTFPG
ncbi:PPOX class F420-dependent oxidoreductase [Kribbella antibiotica]|uniref:PPOX class F420-dependent oxidoreductase n=1 Tax=Kribbella antibiotica TaxID=190195 RepID=UPI00140456F4|nr:PPOX class F420-dependent oxidoreductase [Kribbella antibiotica]